MSRLDILTIIIVGVCVAALGYLLYMTISQMNTPNPDEVVETTPIEPANSDSFTYEDSVYAQTYNQEGALTEASQPESYSDNSAVQTTPAITEAEPKTAVTRPDPVARTSSSGSDTKNTSSSNTPTTSVRGVSGGGFLVIAGTFSQRTNAERRVAELKRLGYLNAEVSIFDGGAYAVALVDRFDDRASAQDLAQDVRSKGVDAFVKVKN